MTEEEKIIKEIEKAKQIQLLALAEHCKEDLFFLANDILDYKLMTEKVHRPLTAVLQSLVQPKEEYLKDIPTDTVNYEDDDRNIFNNNISMDDLRKRFRLILMPRGTFKCVSPDSKITMSDGSTTTADYLKPGDKVLSYTKDKGFISAKIEAVKKNESQNMLELSLRSGRTIRVSDNHPIMTIKGFVDAGKLSVGSRVMSWAGKEIDNKKESDQNEAWILGLMVGDGACTNGKITVASKESIDKLQECCNNLGLVLKKISGKYNYSFKGVYSFMRKWGIEGKTSWTKKLPNIFDQSLEFKKAFIGGYFSADGHFEKGGKASFTTVSRDLAFGISDLMKTIGVFSDIKYYKYSYSSFYRVNITDPTSINRLIKLPIFSKKNIGFSNQDGMYRTVPKEWREIAKPYQSRKKGWRIDNNYHTSFTKFRKFADEIDMEWSCTDEVVWDEIKSIEKYEGEAIDFSIKDTHTFLIDGLVTHNSTISTISFPLQLLLINPDIRILIDSETYDKSRAFMAEIRGHLESNERYRALFKVLHGVYPDERKGVDKWGDTEINIAARRKKAKEPNLSCSGVGVTKVGMHYDVIMSDDLHSEKNVTTKEQIQQVIDHYKLNLSLLEPTGFMTVIGTRWDYLDLYQYLIDNEKHRFCVYAQQAERQGGELLFPERLTAQFLKEQRMSQGSSIYSMQYQNLPIDDETATFKYSQMKKVDESFVKDMPINWFLMVDPAISQESTADDTAFVVAGFDLQRNIYLRDIVYGKFMPSEIIDQIFYLYEKHHPKAVGIESVAFQKTLIYSVNDKMRERNWAFPIKEVKRKSRSKEDRIKGLQPYYENGRVYHLRNCPNINEFEYQLIHFPKGRKDDIIDAMADILEIGYPPDSRQKNISKEDREKRRKLFKSLSKPRSRVTNY